MAKRIKRQASRTSAEPLPLSEQVRQIIANCGLSHGELHRRSGVHTTTIGRFMRGERALSQDALDRLAAVLGMEVVAHGPEDR